MDHSFFFKSISKRLISIICLMIYIIRILVDHLLRNVQCTVCLFEVECHYNMSIYVHFCMWSSLNKFLMNCIKDAFFNYHQPRQIVKAAFLQTVIHFLSFMRYCYTLLVRLLSFFMPFTVYFNLGVVNIHTHLAFSRV